MYRQGGKDHEISSVALGPYAGPTRQLDWLAMPAYSRERLLRALSGEAPRSTPIASVLGKQGSASLRNLFDGLAPRGARSFAVGLCALAVAAVVVPFGRVVLPWPAVVLGGLTVALAVLLARADTRGRVGGRAGLQAFQGTHLLPLDVVEIHGTRITVTPLGSIRRARLEEEGSAQSLRLVFPETEHIFPLAAQNEAIAALEQSHALLQKYTHGDAFAEAIDRDPFFEIRSGDHWAEHSPSAQAVARRQQHGWALGLVTFLLGTLGFAGVRALSAEAIWRHHVMTEDYLGYLKSEGTTAPNAQQAQDELRERGAKRGALDIGRSTQPSPQEQLAALTRFEARAKDADAVQRISRMINDRSELLVWFDSFPELQPSAPTPASRLAVAPKELARRDENVGNALRIAISEAVPREVMPVVVMPWGQTETRADYLGIRPTARWRFDRFETPGFEVSFRVVWHVHGFPDREFQLTIPPPERPMNTVRKMSLFALPAAADADVTTFAETARAWDRLYDELFSLFFAGDPRVPLSLREQLKDFE